MGAALYHVRTALTAPSVLTALEVRDRLAGRQLNVVQDRRNQLRPRDILLVTCLRNEQPRMPAFVAHYRKLGVGHFFVIDNGSTDGFRDWAAEQPDLSVWYTEASYRKSHFGMLWVNDLLRRHGRGRWCVVVDPDEFLVYPNMDTRSLHALTEFLQIDKRPCMHALLIDAYSDKPLGDTILEEGENPFTVCPFFDQDGYLQREGWGNGTWVQGGPRMRVHFRDQPASAPALNKIPLIRWQRHYHFRHSTHDAYPRRLNWAHAEHQVSLTGALFHFKLVATLQEKAAEEAARGEHYDAGREYGRYRTARVSQFFEPGVSVRYTGPRQLVDLGLMGPGRWF